MVNYWVVRMTLAKEGEKVVDFQIAEKNNFIGVKWNRVGDLSWLTEDTREDLKEKFRTLNPDANEHEIGNWTGQLIRFVYDMEVDDIVILPIYTNAEFEPDGTYYWDDINYLIGKIKSGYYFAVENPEDKCTCQHRRDVEWQKTISKDDFVEPLKSNATRGTVNNVNKYEELLQLHTLHHPQWKKRNLQVRSGYILLMEEKYPSSLWMCIMS